MTVEQLNQSNQAQGKTSPLSPLKRQRNQYRFLQFNLLLRVMKKGKISLRKVLNVLSCDLAYLLKWKKGSRAPYILSLELWNECNAGCLFCRDKKGKIHHAND